MKADNCPHKTLQTRKDHADYMPHSRQRPTESRWTLRGGPAQRPRRLLNPAMVSGGGVENSSAQLEQQRQTESQAGVNSIREWRHRVTQRRPSTRERVQQTRALLN